MSDRLLLPLQVDPVTGRFRTVQRGSDQERAQRLLAIANTRPGDRWDALTMGVEPLEFAERPIDTTQLAAALAEQAHDVPVELIERTRLLADTVAGAAADLEIRYPATQDA